MKARFFVLVAFLIVSAATTFARAAILFFDDFTGATHNGGGATQRERAGLVAVRPARALGQLQGNGQSMSPDLLREQDG